MITRRSILGLLGSVAAWFAARPVVALTVPEPVRELGGLKLPVWCPHGWIPVMGQRLTSEGFPYLFTIREQAGRKRFVPPFFGKQEVLLPTYWPRIIDDLRASGWQDHLTHIERKPDNKVVVSVMATEPMQAANGRWSPAGFYMATIIDRDAFEDFYGKIPNDQVDNYWNNPIAVLGAVQGTSDRV